MLVVVGGVVGTKVAVVDGVVVAEDEEVGKIGVD